MNELSTSSFPRSLEILPVFVKSNFNCVAQKYVGIVQAWAKKFVKGIQASLFEMITNREKY